VAHPEVDETAPAQAAREKELVLVGRLSAFASVAVAILVARPLLGQSDQAFQFIQEFTGFFTPGIVVMFMIGLFWKRGTEGGAIAAAVSSVLLSYLGKIWWPELPFMNRMGLVFLAALALAVLVSLTRPERRERNFIVTRDVSYATPASFNIPAVGVIVILIALYGTYW
jgi:SSS family solute:Na+ symporter